MEDRKDIGKKGEDEAVQFLHHSGYQLLERNYRVKKSEIDLIASKDGLLIFVEVKARSSNAFGFPESFVSEEQANRIMLAADEYQFLNNLTFLSNYKIGLLLKV